MINERFATIRPMTEEDVVPLQQAAAEDGHPLVVAPTDVIWKNGERVGFFAVHPMPVIATWFSAKKLTARDSLSLINTMELVQLRLGARGIYVPCDKASPFHPVMKPMGYQHNDKVDFFFKPFYV